KEINGYFTTPPEAAGAVGRAAAGPAEAAAPVLARPRGVPLRDARPVATFGELRDDGSTACGAWIYTGLFAPAPDRPLGYNHPANRKGDDWVALGWGFSWPANRRVMYNRASADPDGNPWPKEARLARQFAPRDGKTYRGYVYWDADRKRWVGLDVPDFIADK